MLYCTVNYFTCAVQSDFSILFVTIHVDKAINHLYKTIYHLLCIPLSFYCISLTMFTIDAVPPFDSESAYEIIKKEMNIKNSLNEIFLNISPLPVASASIGQVYKGDSCLVYVCCLFICIHLFIYTCANT